MMKATESRCAIDGILLLNKPEGITSNKRTAESQTFIWGKKSRSYWQFRSFSYWYVTHLFW